MTLHSKKIIFFIGVLVVGGLFLLKNIRFNSCQNKSAISYMLENKKHCLLIADSRSEWSRGLMNIRKPVNYDGMLFIFPEKDIQYFWNGNTYVDLDIYWLDDERVVGKTELPSIEKTKEPLTINSPKPVNRVIEIIK